ncbi:MAG: PSD1 domain-containing protein [Verrucomicrobiae bacterium]|nr:PSD1 domain-containing protein [Verrucomicrobiae bacterium]
MNSRRKSPQTVHLRVAVMGLLLTSFPARGAGESDDIAHFETKIRPVLVESCYECHSVESGKAKGGLRLDDREAILRGGDSGPALLPGKPEESLLLAAIRHSDPDLEMPPRKERLPEKTLRDFEQWIVNGAVDPRESANGKEGRTGEDFKSRKQHWSFLPIVEPETPLPQNADWAWNDVDRFVLAKLEENGLEPSSDADPAVLLRRISFDLTGLPPTKEQTQAFVTESSRDPQKAIRNLIENLLASPSFGQRWGRHWLDVVRYSESNGKEANLTYPHAWRYRDYVIDAFDRDLPYNRFLSEQLAGDLLPAENEAERARLLIATGFLAMGPKSLTEMNPAQFVADVADEQIDAISRAFLGGSLACARCHDHKSDPVTMSDYYALAGIFKSTDTRYGTWVDSESSNGGKLIRLPDLPGQFIPNKPLAKEELEKLKSQLAQLEADEKAGREKGEKMRREGVDMQSQFNEMLREALRIIWTRGPIVGRLETVDEEGKALPLCMGVLDAEMKIDSPRYERGDLAHPSGTETRAVPALFGLPSEGPVPKDASGRLELAKWITDPGHPLTARVMANRIWSHLLGAGLVETVDDFGRSGAAPSHPELLDYLALRFQEKGWSIKALIREIVSSRTYAQASTHRVEAFERDPDNRLIWRMSKRRLDAEAMRDAMLAASGELDLSPRPGSLVAELDSQSAGMIGFNKKIPEDLDGSFHRSVYLPVMRDQLPDVLRQFDFAEPSLVTGRRDVTNVPPQALYLMNSDFVRARAAALAKRISQVASTDHERVEAAYQRCFNRSPDEEEKRLLLEFIDAPIPDPTTHAEELEKRWQDLCQALLASADFRMLD